jgi:hypothetical protein
MEASSPGSNTPTTLSSQISRPHTPPRDSHLPSTQPNLQEGLGGISSTDPILRSLRFGAVLAAGEGAAGEAVGCPTSSKNSSQGQALDEVKIGLLALFIGHRGPQGLGVHRQNGRVTSLAFSFWRSLQQAFSVPPFLFQPIWFSHHPYRHHHCDSTFTCSLVHLALCYGPAWHQRPITKRADGGESTRGRRQLSTDHAKPTMQFVGTTRSGDGTRARRRELLEDVG